MRIISAHSIWEHQTIILPFSTGIKNTGQKKRPIQAVSLYSSVNHLPRDAMIFSATLRGASA